MGDRTVVSLRVGIVKFGRALDAEALKIIEPELCALANKLKIAGKFDSLKDFLEPRPLW